MRDGHIPDIEHSGGRKSNGKPRTRMDTTRNSNTWSTKCLEKNKGTEQKEDEAKHITEFSMPGYRSALYSQTIHLYISRV